MGKRNFAELQSRWVATYGEEGAAEEQRHYYKVKRGRKRLNAPSKDCSDEQGTAKRKPVDYTKSISIQEILPDPQTSKRKENRKYKFLAYYISLHAIERARAVGLDPVSYAKHHLRKGGGQRGQPGFWTTAQPSHPIIPQTPGSGSTVTNSEDAASSAYTGLTGATSTPSTMSVSSSEHHRGVADWVLENRDNIKTAAGIVGTGIALASGAGEAAAGVAAAGNMLKYGWRFARSPAGREILQRII